MSSRAERQTPAPDDGQRTLELNPLKSFMVGNYQLDGFWVERLVNFLSPRLISRESSGASGTAIGMLVACPDKIGTYQEQID